MPDETVGDPPACAHDGCPGVVFDQDACLAHVTPAQFDVALAGGGAAQGAGPPGDHGDDRSV
jgi:hypothetical protein